MPCKDHDDDYSFYKQKANNAEEKAQQLEESLCKSRDTLMKLVNLCEENGVKIPENINKRLLVERKEHLKHRLEERQAKLDSLKKEYDNLDQKLSTILSLGGISPTIENKLLEISQEIDRIAKLSNGDLLENRRIF